MGSPWNRHLFEGFRCFFFLFQSSTWKPWSSQEPNRNPKMIIYMCARNSRPRNQEHALLRVIPTLKHYSDIVSDIPSGISYLYNIWHIYSDLFSGIYFDSLFDILSGIRSDMLSGIYSDTISGILFGIYFDILSGSGSFWGILASILTFFLTFFLAFYTTFIHSLRGPFGSAHGDLELAVAVPQCPRKEEVYNSDKG